MADLKITITMKGKGRVLHLLEAHEAARSKDTMGRVGSFVIMAANKRVDRGVDIYGRKIKPSQRVLDEGGQTLRDKGHMVGNYDMTRLKVGSVTIGFGSKREADKAFFHQYGTSNGNPPRPVFGFGRGDKKAIVNIFKDAIDREIKKRSRGMI